MNVQACGCIRPAEKRASHRAAGRRPAGAELTACGAKAAEKERL